MSWLRPGAEVRNNMPDLKLACKGVGDNRNLVNNALKSCLSGMMVARRGSFHY